MPLPEGLRDVLGEILDRDKHLRDEGIVFPELWTHVPVAGFELETAGGKHAGGALMNLAAYTMLGIVVAPDDGTASRIDATLRTYRPTLGLRNVFVKTLT